MRRVVLRESVRIFRKAERGVGSLQLTIEKVPARSIIGLGSEKTMSYGDRIRQAVLFNWRGGFGYVLAEEVKYLEIVK